LRRHGSVGAGAGQLNALLRLLLTYSRTRLRHLPSSSSSSSRVSKQ
jgi:hypothetical protein